MLGLILRSIPFPCPVFNQNNLAALSLPSRWAVMCLLIGILGRGSPGCEPLRRDPLCFEQKYCFCIFSSHFYYTPVMGKRGTLYIYYKYHLIFAGQDAASTSPRRKGTLSQRLRVLGAPGGGGRRRPAPAAVH